MQKIERSFLQEVFAASSAEELHQLVHQAIRLEFSTIPPYLTAMLSLKPGKNREIWNTIHAVVIDEMLHMAIGCNLLNALGGRPALTAPDFLPTYPGPLPMAIGEGLVVSLAPYSRDLVKNVFMEIEEPEDPIEIPVVTDDLAQEDLPTYATIGEFYNALIEKIGDLGNGAFVGDPARQLRSPHWFGSRLVAIESAADAVAALKVVVEEGEGTPLSPLDPDGDFAHYYRFEELWRGRRIAADPTVPDLGYSFSGPEIPFDPSAVWPLAPNQNLADLPKGSRAHRYAKQFAFVFTKLMNVLQACFDGEPKRFDDAMGLMFELKLAGQRLVELNSHVNGLNAGPVFVRVSAP